MKPKKIHRNTLLGQQGVNLVERRLLEMGHVWNPSTIDAGIDGTVELRSPTGTATNLVILVQIKATDRPFPNETEESFRWPVDERDLAYWTGGNAPVILAVTRPRTDEAYWVSVKSYFADASKRASRSVLFDKVRDNLDATAATAFARVARPEGLGVHLGPPPKQEMLLTNLLEVTAFSPIVYVAEAQCDSPGLVWRLLEDALGQEAPAEWYLKEHRIHSFVDLDSPEWREIIDPGSVDAIETEHFSRSHDREQTRDFVRLLNRCLTSRLRPSGIKWSREHRCYYFIPSTRGHPDRTARYRSLKQSPSRQVVKCYRSDDGTIRYCRHSAVKAFFLREGADWLLELTPTYHFTRDGSRADKFREDRLSGIKRLELNSAVRGQVVMWASLLSDSEDSLGLGYPHLRFGHLASVPIDVGIDEALWGTNEPPRPPLGDLPLFIR